MGETVIDGWVALVRNDDPEWDWWTIERAEHDHTERLVPDGPNGYSFWTSGRISDADVEGDSEHMRGIAQAIRERGHYRAKRCAVDASGDRALFWSPRNSRREASVSLAAADRLATQIERFCQSPTAPTSEAEGGDRG